MVDTGLCKKPKVRFPSLMALEKPEQVASSIISAMRRDKEEISVPANLLYVNNFFRNFPMKVGMHMKDFLDSGVEASD